MNLERFTKFLVELSFNNDKPWFDKNRAEYQILRLEFIDFMQELISGISSFDASVKAVKAKQTLFRINRDVRFSNNKNPYKTHFSAAIAGGGRHSSLPIYYVQLGAEESVVAGGIYYPESDQLATIRRFIALNPKKANALLKNKTLLEHFTGLDSDAVLLRFPKGFSEGSSLLKYKSFTVSRAFDAFGMESDVLRDELISSFQKLQPLHKFLREALTYEVKS